MSMEPQNVLLAVMDSARPPQKGSVRVERLSLARRLARGLGRLALVSGIGAVLLPMVHLCGFVMLLFGGPVLGYIAWKAQVLLDEGWVSCPKCGATVPIEAKTPGWPARMHCGACGSTFFIRPDPGS